MKLNIIHCFTIFLCLGGSSCNKERDAVTFEEHNIDESEFIFKENILGKCQVIVLDLPADRLRDYKKGPILSNIESNSSIYRIFKNSDDGCGLPRFSRQGMVTFFDYLKYKDIKYSYHQGDGSIAIYDEKTKLTTIIGG